MKIPHWLAEPLQPKPALVHWTLLTVLVFTIWFVIPISLAVQPNFEYLAIQISLRNLAVILSASFGEEFVFRVLPIVVVLSLFKNKTTFSFLAGIAVAYPFGMWHEWELTQNTCIGLGGIVLTIAYLKFGGASGKPFKGFLACGSIHSACNLSIALIANLVIV